MKTYLSFHELLPRRRSLADRQFGPDGWSFERIPLKDGDTEASYVARMAARKNELGENLLHFYPCRATVRWVNGLLVYVIENSHFSTGRERDKRFEIEYFLPIRKDDCDEASIHRAFGQEYNAQLDREPLVSEDQHVEAIMARVKDRLSKAKLFSSALVSV